jgi:hypothetical protein
VHHGHQRDDDDVRKVGVVEGLTRLAQGFTGAAGASGLCRH